MSDTYLGALNDGANKINAEVLDLVRKAMLPGWIKTSDRAPDKGVFVLIAPGVYDPVSMGKISEYDGVWYDVVDTDQDGDYYHMSSQPTHWMPLPEPPEQ